MDRSVNMSDLALAWSQPNLTQHKEVCVECMSQLSIMSSSAASTEAVAAAKKAQQEMYSALLAKREVLAHGLGD